MKIVLGMPTLGSIDTRMAVFLYALLKTTQHKISILHTNRAEIATARNEIIKDFLRSDGDYLLFLDDDNIPERIDCLDKMIEAKKPIISGLVPSRLPDKDGRHRLCIFKESTESGRHEYIQQMDIPEGEIIEIANCGMGCVLIEREVVRLVQSEFDRPCEARMTTYYKAETEWIRDERMNPTKIEDGMLRFRRYMSEDLMFFDRAREFGINIYAHTGVRCEHIGQNEIISINTHIGSQL